MHSRLRKASDSLVRGTEEMLSAKDKFSYKEELLHLVRTRDFISLLLTYPVKLEEEGILKAWINAFSQWRAQLLTWMSTDDHDGMTDKPWRELTQKALRCMEGLMPNEMILQIEHSGMFDYNNTEIPEAILDLTVDLAIEQLIQTLFSRDDYVRNIRYVRLSTRDFAEKRSVVDKIAAALEDRRNLFGNDKDFLRALWIDALIYQSDVEVRVQEEINAMMAGVVTEDDDILRTRGVEEEMANNRHLVILVDGDSYKKLDPRKVHFPVGTVVLLITTEPSAQTQEGDELTCIMDLNIRTLDHALPWEVFCNHAGSSVVYAPRAIQRIAVQIVGECRGHLLAIVLVAKSLRNVKGTKQWKLALDKLSYTNPSYDYQESDRIGISRAMVNAFVNIIWEDIEETQKLCLELSLFVHNIKDGVPRMTLMSNWVNTAVSHKLEAAQHLFTIDSVDIELEYTRIQAGNDIEELQDRSILLQCRSGYVRLPVETYDMIKSLHSLNPSIIRNGALGLTEIPHITRWHGLIRIELMDNKICELPPSPDCPKLRVLLLQGNVDLTDIPNSFFDHMPMLRYLDLSYTSIRDLPHSISKLTDLKKFYLKCCDLFMELPPEIGQLKNLEELDLDETLITHLPKEVQGLINLQSLTLCFEGYHHVFGYGRKDKQISNSTIIPPGVISNLTQLNYLTINVDPEDERWNENIVVILPEVLRLENLQSVTIYVPNAELLELIPPHKSLNFRLVVGHHMRRFISRVTLEVEEKFKHSSSSIKFVNGVNVPNGVKMNLWRFRTLYLDRHMTIKSLSEFELKNLNRLQACILAECNEMETVVGGSYLDKGFERVLSNLKSLSVFYMKNLRSIYKATTPGFYCLKSIALHTCPMLTTIFTSSFIRNLSSLEELIVEDCPKVTTLISHDSSEHETHIFLPRLRMISLLYLPELVSIFSGLHVKHGIEKMGFYYCPKLQSLSKSELSSESLRVIRGENKWWEALKWNEAEWGCASRPNFLNPIFSPINEETDIMTQLAAHDNRDQFFSREVSFTFPSIRQMEVTYDKHHEEKQQFTDYFVKTNKNQSNVEVVKMKAGMDRPEKERESFLDKEIKLQMTTSKCDNEDQDESNTWEADIFYGNSATNKPLPMKATDRQLSWKDIEIIKVIGKGNEGVVQLVKHKWTGQFFALKVIRMNIEDSMRKQMAQKHKVNQSAQCPYVVVCYQLFYDNGAMSIFLEYMDGGSLADLLKKVKIIPEPYLAAICKQVLKGLVYLHHEIHIIHRDLKPSNLLINYRGEVKITDFSASAIMETASDQANTFIGTFNYMSPERISGSRHGYNYKSDIWSFGLILLECAMGRFPYTPPDQSERWESCFELMEAIVDQPPPSAPSEQFSTAFCTFISACLQKDPKDRPSAKKLVKHPFIDMYEDLDVDLSAYFSNAGSPPATL